MEQSNDVKSVRYLSLLVAFSISIVQAEEWRKVAFVGSAKVKSISGLVEVIQPEERILREGEIAKPGEVLRVWRGANLVIQMEGSKSFVRADGPVLLRLAPEENFNRASLTGSEEKVGFVVRAVRGHGRYSEDGDRWGDLETGMILKEGTRVRPFRDSILDFYHNGARVALRVSDHKKAVALKLQTVASSNSTMDFASQAP
jgi:hypothetical protein